MFVALFLTPWLIMYALSTVVFNHYGWFEKLYGGNLERFEKEREIHYPVKFAADADERAIASRIRKDLNIHENLPLHEEEDDRYVFLQNGDGEFTPRRITYIPAEQKLIIEKQALVMPNFLTRLHSRVGYGHSAAPRVAWAISVDLTIAATILWILSGLWMWWELKVTRRWGILFALLGPAVFAFIWYLG